MHFPRVRSLAAALMIGTASAAAQAPATSPAAARADSLYRAGDYAAAAAAYDALARETPTVFTYWARLGIAQQQLSKFNEAIAAYEHALTIQRGPAIMYNLGAAYARLGKPDLAFAWVDSSVAKGFLAESTFVTDPDFAPYHGDAGYAAALAAFHRKLNPCEAQPESQRFDFWVGEWDVTGLGGAHVGTSSVQKILGGCVVFENWTASQGIQGKSLNAYNPGLGMWQQFWMSQTGNVTEYHTSRWVGPSLEFTALPSTPGSPNVQRLTFTPIDANTVRQHGESSTDGGVTWTTTYDLYYHRKK